MRTLFFILLLNYSNIVSCQNSNSGLMKEAEEKLRNNKANISAILADKKYDALHPETSFRELIKKYAKAEILSIATDSIPGKKIKVIGWIKNTDGKPIANALIYLYHTDSRGWYAADAPHVSMNEGDMHHARLFGYVKTDKEGKFELHTIKPSGYPRSDLPAHIHVHVEADGYQQYITEFLFDDDTRLVGRIRENAIRDKFFIAKPEKATLPFEQQFNYTIALQKKLK